jgi:DNA-directed RNA polymerase specialized sigma24 family protein
VQVALTEALATDPIEAEVLRLYPGLVRRLALVLRDAVEAEDVAQSAVVRALEARASFRGGDARAWLYTIGLRLAFNELRPRPLGRPGRARTAAASGAPDERPRRIHP